MKVVATGGAGFIGSHLVERLLRDGYRVIIIDNLSAGSLENLSQALGDKNLKVIIGDLKEPGGWVEAFRGAEAVFHLAANPEVRVSTQHPRIHYEENVLATFNVLEAARRHGVRHVIFASSSTVYGDATIIPTPETHPLNPISVYGASKAAAEQLVKAYANLYGLRAVILRYANIVGPRLRHGVIHDFLVKLREDPYELEILGDGTQRKSYLYIDDAVEATVAAYDNLARDAKPYMIYNVGNRDWTTVKEIADVVVRTLGLNEVRYRYRPATPDGRGWPGDVKLMLLDITKITGETGWQPKYTSREAVERTARQLAKEIH